jgi:quercetin dioxygenase-like cupin family protein
MEHNKAVVLKRFSGRAAVHLRRNKRIRRNTSMPIPSSNEDGTMTADRAQFNLLNEIAEADQYKPWASGIYSRTLFKKPDLRIVLISMESAAQMKEHHADGTSSLYVLKGYIRYSTRGQVYNLRAGSLFTLGASIKHSVEAMEESGFLLTISWPSDRQLQDMPHRGYGT